MVSADSLLPRAGLLISQRPTGKMPHMARLRPPHLTGSVARSGIGPPLTASDIRRFRYSLISPPALHQLSFCQPSSLILRDVKVGIVTHRGADIIPAADGGTWIREAVLIRAGVPQRELLHYKWACK